MLNTSSQALHGSHKTLRLLSALLLTAVATVALLATIRLTGAFVADPLTQILGGGDRGFALARISVSVIGEAVFLVALYLGFRTAKRPLLEPQCLSLGKPLGWLISIVLAVLWIWSVTVHGPLQSQPVLEISSFNFFGSAIAGLGAGSLEEVLYRGVLICFLARRGFRTWSQVISSALFFGFAHVGWGIIAGEVDLAAAMAAIVATSTLGLALGVMFVAAGRCLTPAIAAHAMINIAIEPWLFLSIVVNQA